MYVYQSYHEALIAFLNWAAAECVFDRYWPTVFVVPNVFVRCTNRWLFYLLNYLYSDFDLFVFLHDKWSMDGKNPATCLRNIDPSSAMCMLPRLSVSSSKVRLYGMLSCSYANSPFIALESLDFSECYWLLEWQRWEAEKPVGPSGDHWPLSYTFICEWTCLTHCPCMLSGHI